MAAVPYSGVPEQSGTTRAPDVSQRPQSVTSSPGSFGAGTAAGAEALGQGALQASDFFGKVAAEDASNQYQEGVNKILYGDPKKQVIGDDGKPVPDTGYMGLKGDKALRARPDVDRAMEDLRKNLKGGLYSLKADVQFDDISRRYKSITDAAVGNHARTQANVYAAAVNTASAKVALDEISRNAEDPAKAADAENNLISAYVKNAELAGGGPELLREAHGRARQDALGARLDAIAVSDPAKAMRMLEENRGVAGAKYDNFAAKYRVRAYRQEGQQTADWVMTGQPPPAGDNAKEVLRHFEGFREQPYWDRNHWRVGYGSDTVTGPDGKPTEVTQDTRVTREGAERDLDRRAALSQRGVQQKIGAGTWNSLSPKAQASLTSVAYNYGTLPDSVAAAARSGDPAQLASSIRALSKDNEGVNAGRRHSEANNISSEGTTEPRAQSDVLNEVFKMGLQPEAEAAAVARINHSYAVQKNAKVASEAMFKERVKDSSTEALVTGATTNPIAKEDFLTHYGPIDGPRQYQNYISDVQYGADYKSMETMPDAEQQRLIDARLNSIPPGAQGYDHAVQNSQRLQKAAEKIQTQRRDDPAGAVDKMPAVREAFAKYDPKDPASFAPVAAARLAAQESLGVEGQYQSPITKREALNLTAPLSRAIPGQELPVLKELAGKFDKMFGDNAEQAFAFAIRAHGKNVEQAQMAASVMRSIALGHQAERDALVGADAANDQAAQQKALTGTARPTPARPRVIGNPESALTTEPTTLGEKPSPPPRAIEFLLRNPTMAPDFDKQYGTGLAKEVLTKYGTAPPPGVP